MIPKECENLAEVDFPIAVVSTRPRRRGRRRALAPAVPSGKASGFTLVFDVVVRLANALSALNLKGSEEKRLLDAMLLAVPR